MNITLAENAGFCFGVNKAVETINSLIEKTDRKIYTLGPVIHNTQLNDELRKKGVEIIDGLEQATQPGFIVIRAHGITLEQYDLIEGRGHELIDLTCPYVRKVQMLVRDKQKDGYNIIIVGDKNHPEVIGIKGWSNNTAYVVNEKSDVDEIPDKDTKVCVVAQTTITFDKWLEIIEYIDKLFKKVLKFDTICNATSKRQKEGFEIAANVDMMLVIGSQDSSNTQKLYEICKSSCENTYKVETVKDLPFIDTSKIKNIGITAGASTPSWVIKEVVDRMEELEKQQELEQSIDIQEREKGNKEAEQGSMVQNQENLNDLQAESIQSKDIIQGDTQSTAIQGQTGEVDEKVEEAVEQAEETEQVQKGQEQAESKDEAQESQESISADSSDETQAQDETQENDEDINFADAIKGTSMGLQYGSIVKGTIVRFDKNDVIVNINYKFEGVVPVQEYSSDPDFDPEKELKVGDEIDVLIVNINQKDCIVQLSRKEIDEKNKLDFFRQAKKDGTPIEAVIVEVVKGGVIARANGEKIFVPASQVSDRFVKDLNTLLKEKITLRVIEFDRRKKKIVGSARVLIEEQKQKKEQEIWDKIQVGEECTGIVSGLTDFGAFVDIGGVDGLIYLTELSWKKIKHPSEVLQKGDTVTVKVLEADREKKRISLGYRRSEDNPWLNITDRYNAGDIIKGKVVGILPFGAFVEIEKGLDGLVHVSQISNKRINKVESVLHIGMDVEAKIVDINADSQRISLSIKEVNPIDPPESEEEEDKKKERRYGKRADKKPGTVTEDSTMVKSEPVEGAASVAAPEDEVIPAAETVTEEKTNADGNADTEQKSTVKNDFSGRKDGGRGRNSESGRKVGEPRRGKQPREKEPTSHTEEMSNRIGDMLSGLNLLANLKLEDSDTENSDEEKDK